MQFSLPSFDPSVISDLGIGKKLNGKCLVIIKKSINNRT